MLFLLVSADFSNTYWFLCNILLILPSGTVIDGFLWFLTSFDQYWHICSWFSNFRCSHLEQSHFDEQIYFQTLSLGVLLSRNVSYGKIYQIKHRNIIPRVVTTNLTLWKNSPRSNRDVQTNTPTRLFHSLFSQPQQTISRCQGCASNLWRHDAMTMISTHKFVNDRSHLSQ